MRKFISFTFLIFTFHSGLAGATNSQIYDAEIHETLLRYAGLAGIAYGDPGEIYCLDPKNDNSETPPKPNDCPSEIEKVTVNTLPISKYIDRSRDNEGSKGIEILKDNSTGEEFITCSSGEGLLERIAIAINFVSRNDEISILPKIAIVVSQIPTKYEELKVVTLQQEGSEGSVFGIQGTNFWRFKQIRTSIQKLIGNSCAFDVVVDVARNFFSDCRNKSITKMDTYSIVGHSLGGAVAQYVAHKFGDSTGFMTECNNDVNFQAYSFNSIGMRNRAVRDSGNENINSVRIAGEILERLGTKLNRRQIGKKIRYGGQLNQPSWNELKLHEISTVKKVINHCLSGKGFFKYTPPREIEPTTEVNCRDIKHKHIY